MENGIKMKGLALAAKKYTAGKKFFFFFFDVHKPNKYKHTW